MDASTAEKAGEQAGAVAENASRAVLETGHLLGLLIEKLQGWVETAVQMLPNLIAAVVILLLFGVASRLVSALVLRAGRRSRLESELVKLLSSTARLGTLAIGMFVALGVLQLEKTVTSLLAGVGVIGLALGFAFQDIAANFMAGTIMALRRPFREGQLVETHGVMGFVKRVTLRATVVRNFQGQDVIIPNKDVLQNPIVNYEQSGERRVDVDVGVSYDDDLEQAKAVAIEAVESVPELDAEREISLVYKGFGSSSIDFTVRFWLADPSTFLVARSNAVMAVKKAFDENGITIPFPIRTLDVPSHERPPSGADRNDDAEEEAA